MSASGVKKQLIPFVIIGVGCAVLDFGITYPVDELTSLSREMAKAIGWVVGTIVAYVLNSRFAFHAEVSAKKAGGVFVLYATTFAVQILLYRYSALPLRALGLNKFFTDLISFIIAQGVATVTNFVLQRRVIFREETKIIESQEPVVKQKAPMGDGNPPVPPSAVTSTNS
ncbi:hypothetical protein GCM10009631_20230 [Corynebacterium glaucum]|uniref:GtrA family protein n=1 Tax=Corynebacterium glaucum TaxID=187491 RepID=UPI0025B44309|nr:GtrA family protein [Corynebacterium glaucum]